MARQQNTKTNLKQQTQTFANNQKRLKFRQSKQQSIRNHNNNIIINDNNNNQSGKK